VRQLAGMGMTKQGMGVGNNRPETARPKKVRRYASDRITGYGWTGKGT
jgi:hypothetical protein